jgi:hypothetical protein
MWYNQSKDNIMTQEKPIQAPLDKNHPNYYLDKVTFNAALKEHKTGCLAAEAAGEELPRVSEYIGACFVKIATGLAHKHNFRSYSFVNEMKSDAIMTMLKYVRSYDPDRRNPDTGQATSALSYFTQTAHYAFIGRITAEAKQTKIKRALVYSADIDTFSENDEDAGDFRLNLSEFLIGLGKDEVNNIVQKKKVKPNKPGGLEGFI